MRLGSHTVATRKRRPGISSEAARTAARASDDPSNATTSGRLFRSTRTFPRRSRGRQRSERKAARTSVVNSSGSSHAAKWPPFSTSLKYARPG